VRRPSINPATLRKFHLVRVYVWSIQIPIALLTGLKNSVPYVVFLSLAALVEGALGAYMGSRAEEANDNT
jgi:hypothetical protein